MWELVKPCNANFILGHEPFQTFTHNKMRLKSSRFPIITAIVSIISAS